MSLIARCVTRFASQYASILVTGSHDARSNSIKKDTVNFSNLPSEISRARIRRRSSAAGAPLGAVATTVVVAVCRPRGSGACASRGTRGSPALARALSGVVLWPEIPLRSCRPQHNAMQSKAMRRQPVNTPARNPLEGTGQRLTIDPTAMNSKSGAPEVVPHAP